MKSTQHENELDLDLVFLGIEQENGMDSVDDSDSLGNSGSKKSNLTPTTTTPGTGTKEKRKPFFKKVRVYVVQLLTGLRWEECST